MNRRDTVFALAASLAVPRTAFAQSPKSPPRVAILWLGSPESDAKFREAFAQGMLERGYVDGKNCVLDESFLAGRNERIPQALADFLSRRPAVMVVAGSHAVHAARAATSTVPIVFVSVADPVGQKIVASLAHPGGNLTGNTILTEVLVVKRLELLREILPKAVEVGYLVDPTNPGSVTSFRGLAAPAKKLGIRLTQFDASNERELDRALAAIGGKRLDAVMLGRDAQFTVFRKKIIDSLARSRLPAFFAAGEGVVDGGLMTYSTNWRELVRNTASFVDRILKGAKPGDLPIEQPTKFELVINLRTAKALGITIPQSVLLRADEVIE